jgi:hypothetical protein
LKPRFTAHMRSAHMPGYALLLSMIQNWVANRPTILPPALDGKLVFR